MFGFVAAVFAELASGVPVAEQLGIAPVSIGLAFALFSVASLIPILKVPAVISFPLQLLSGVLMVVKCAATLALHGAQLLPLPI